MEERNDIVIYQSEDGLVKMEAMVDPVNETIWASQKAIASLFACTKQNVSYHMGKIFASGELDRTAVVKEILTTVQSGARGLSEDKVLYYNLDAIISVGYKINSVQATKFRIWSTSILREYMRHGYVVNRNIVSEQKYEDLKRAMGLLENVFNKELLLSSDQVTDLFDVIRDYTYALDTLDAYDYQSLKIADTTAPERFHAAESRIRGRCRSGNAQRARNPVDYLRTFANVSGRHMFSSTSASLNRGAISLSRNPAMPQPMRVT